MNRTVSLTLQDAADSGRGGEITLTMANCLVLLSQAATTTTTNPAAGDQHHIVGHNSPEPTRVFECKTCNRRFPSFQALGGHRAGHKKPRGLLSPAAASSSAGATSCCFYDVSPSPPPVKPRKTHECTICGVEFPVGQALGGHMRRHRGSRAAASSSSEEMMISTPAERKRARVLDLNLTPYENDVKLMFKLGKAAADNNSPMVDCFY